MIVTGQLERLARRRAWSALVRRSLAGRPGASALHDALADQPAAALAVALTRALELSPGLGPSAEALGLAHRLRGRLSEDGPPAGPAGLAAVAAGLRALADRLGSGCPAAPGGPDAAEEIDRLADEASRRLVDRLREARAALGLDPGGPVHPAEPLPGVASGLAAEAAAAVCLVDRDGAAGRAAGGEGAAAPALAAAVDAWTEVLDHRAGSLPPATADLWRSHRRRREMASRAA